jgi:HEAT repeat protein
MLSEGGASMVDHLRKALGSSDAPARTRGVAADALRLLRDPASADEAAAVLERGTDREVAAACLRLLEVLGTANHAPTVRRFVHDDDFVLRALAVTALGALGTGDDDARLLDEALDDPSPWVALHAARALHNADRLDILRRAAASRRPGADAAGEILLGATA